MNMTEEDIEEPTLGTHSIDTSPVSLSASGEEDFIPFEIETEAVFKRLARDIYETDAAGIREPLTNAVTAILRAVEMGEMSKDEGVIEIKVRDDGGSTELMMRDNGLGMTRERIQRIVAVIGASEARDAGELAGQFGMGFLAVFRLVGIDGGFEMHTNPRYSDEEPISGIWKSGGFTLDADALLSDGLDKDEYGTKFNFILKDDISRMEIREWVSEYAEWARVPVVYEESVNGRLEFEENYGGFEKNLETQYDDNAPYVVYEDEYMRAVTSPEASNDTILLDVPCERNRGNIDTILGDVDIRLKNENGVIVDGPNEGKMVVSDGEYDNMSEERKEEFIPERNVMSSDVVMPKPVGTRRVLQKNPEFWNWVEDKLTTRAIEEMSSVMEDVDDFDDMMNLEESNFRMMIQGAKKPISRRYNGGFEPDKDGKKIRKWFDNNLDVSLNEDFSEQVAAMTYRVRFATRGTEDVQKQRNLRRSRPALAVYNSYHSDEGQIYMGCRLTQDKVEIVWEDNEDNYVFSVESTDEYEHYEDLLGWNKLTDISKSNIEDFDISEETLEDFLGEDAQSKSKKTQYQLTLHFASSGSNTSKVSPEKLAEKIEDDDDVVIRYRDIDNIILFPSHMDENISDNYWVANKNNPIAKCRKKDWETLKNYDIVNTLDGVIESSKQVEFTTSKGNYTIEQFDEECDDNMRIMFHVLEEPYRGKMADDEYISHAEEFVNEKVRSKYDDTEYVYAPITTDTLGELHPTIKNHKVLFGDVHAKTLASTSSIRNDVRIYMWVRLYEWRDSDEFDSLYSNLSRITLDDGGYDMVETMRQGFEQGPYSQK